MATDTRERMIAATVRLLQHRGYHGTSLNDILAASDAPRGSLYFHFPGGKDQLASEATRAAIDETTAHLRRSLDCAASPGQGVRSFLEAAAEAMAASDYTFGCPVAPVILDAAGGVPELERMCREAFEEWIALLREAFVGAGIDPARAESLALLVDSALEGLLLIARAYGDVGPIMTVAAELEAAVDGAVPAPARD